MALVDDQEVNKQTAKHVVAERGCCKKIVKNSFNIANKIFDTDIVIIIESIRFSS